MSVGLFETVISCGEGYSLGDDFHRRGEHFIEEGERHRGRAYHWLAETYRKYVLEVPPDLDNAEGGSAFLSCVIGGYRLFEFSLALENQRLLFASLDDEVRLLEQGNPSRTETPRGYLVTGPQEIGAWLANAVFVVSSAPELADSSHTQRWIDTIPESVPPELTEFVRGYTDQLHYGKDALAGSPSPEEYAGRVHALYVERFVRG